jgi:hypothetical protein
MNKANDIKVLVGLAICTAMYAADHLDNIEAANSSDEARRNLLAAIDKLQAEVAHLRGLQTPVDSLSWYQRILKADAEQEQPMKASEQDQIEAYMLDLTRLINDYHVPGNIVSKLIDTFGVIAFGRYAAGVDDGAAQAKNKVKAAIEEKLNNLLGA